MPTVSSSFHARLEPRRPAALRRICVTNRITCAAWGGIEMEAFNQHGTDKVSLGSDEPYIEVAFLGGGPALTVRPLLVGFKYASVLLGVGEQSLRNALSRNVLPFGTVKFMGRRMMKMNDLESFVATLPTTMTAVSSSRTTPQSALMGSQRKRGRPRSQEQQQLVALKSRTKTGFRGGSS